MSDTELRALIEAAYQDRKLLEESSGGAYSGVDRQIGETAM